MTIRHHIINKKPQESQGYNQNLQNTTTHGGGGDGQGQGRFMKNLASSTTALLFFFVLFIATIVYCLDLFVITGSPLLESILSTKTSKTPSNFHYTLDCTNITQAKTCRVQHPSPPLHSAVIPDGTCPEYFRWIHEDLKWWKETGITRETIDRARDVADFKLWIVKGKVYVERYAKAFQTRDIFTIWGILQLVRLYPGMVPDLELMFSCADLPVIHKRGYEGSSEGLPPPSIFYYNGNESTVSIVFPDWTFWGWAETSIRPWEGKMEEIKEGNRRRKWKDRIAYAYWKGNPSVSRNRVHLLQCNSSQFNTILYSQDWDKEIEQGFKSSNLSEQCTHRYKIYIEGISWSVSSKYILACDSTTLMINPIYYDFFFRSLVPMEHYWPIRADKKNKCNDLKFAVDWGNTHPHKAEEIGKKGTKFVEEGLKLKNVYDYMFHVLNAYAKLLKFKVEKPVGVKQVCLERLACRQQGLVKKFMLESMVKSPSQKLPCIMPSPFDEDSLKKLFEKKGGIIKQVEGMVSKYMGEINHNNNSS